VCNLLFLIVDYVLLFMEKVNLNKIRFTYMFITSVCFICINTYNYIYDDVDSMNMNVFISGDKTVYISLLWSKHLSYNNIALHILINCL
jgi:hypothetical protein